MANKKPQHTNNSTIAHFYHSLYVDDQLKMTEYSLQMRAKLVHILRFMLHYLHHGIFSSESQHFVNLLLLTVPLVQHFYVTVTSCFFYSWYCSHNWNETIYAHFKFLINRCSSVKILNENCQIQWLNVMLWLLSKSSLH